MTDELESVRRGIDRVDNRIVKLLRKRGVLVSAAGKLKKSEDGVRDSKRVEAVIAKVRELAVKEGANPDLVEKVYRTLIGCFIEQELSEFKEVSKHSVCNCYFCEQKRK